METYDQHTTLLQRTLDLAMVADDAGKGPKVGWVAMKGGQMVEEGHSKDSFLLSDDTRNLAQWKDSTLFLSINPFPDTRTLTSFCARHRIETYYLATAPDSPVCQTALALNRRYLTWLHNKRPYLILKWAETADRFIARADYQPYWISNTHARKLVHQWRTQEAAIWVGNGTYRHDNPRLNVRDWQGNDPIRLVIDPQLQLDRQLHVFDRSQPTLCYNTLKEETHQNLEFVSLPDQIDWKSWIQALLNDLHQRQIQSVFVEGGATLLTFLLKQGWWDEARVFRAPISFGTGLAAPTMSDDYYHEQQRVSDNTLTIYRNARPRS